MAGDGCKYYLDGRGRVREVYIIRQVNAGAWAQGEPPAQVRSSSLRHVEADVLLNERSGRYCA